MPDMDYAVALQFEDGATRIIRCGADEIIADAAYRQKINVPMDCRDGVCGTCKARLEVGQVIQEDYIDDALSPAEAAEGYVLLCQSRPKADCVVQVLASSLTCKVTPTRHQGRIRHTRHLSDTTIALTIDVDEPKTLAFLPGQYVNITVPGTTIERSYSFASAPGVSAEFLIRDIPGGQMTSFLNEMAAPAMPISFVGPFGTFYLREIKRPVLMLAGGTGLAPFLSMLKSIDGSQDQHRIHLVYGVTRDADLVSLEHLNRAQERLAGFSFTTCVADRTSSHPSRGFVTDHIEPDLFGGEPADIYLCGPPAMVDAVHAWIEQRTMPHAHFFYEKFAPSQAAG